MNDFNLLSANSQDIQKFQAHQKARSFLVVLVIGVPVFIAMLAYLFFQDSIWKPQKNTSNPVGQVQPTDDFGLSPSADQSTTPNTALPNISSDPTNPDSPVSQSPSTSPQPSSATIPDGVINAVNSIEANGINNNPYISSNLDTSQIPSGTSITFHRSSWFQFNETLGSLSVSASVLGTTKDGTVIFGIEDGSWKAVDYSFE